MPKLETKKAAYKPECFSLAAKPCKLFDLSVHPIPVGGELISSHWVVIASVLRSACPLVLLEVPHLLLRLLVFLLLPNKLLRPYIPCLICLFLPLRIFGRFGNQEDLFLRYAHSQPSVLLIVRIHIKVLGRVILV